MKTLLIFRHAKAEPAEDKQPDFERPLAKRGRRDAPRMGELLVAEHLTPQLILSSTAARAKETTELVREAMQYSGPVSYHRELYMASPSTYVALLRRDGGDSPCVMVVGHNPALEDLAQLLTGKHVTLATAAVAVIKLNIDAWSELSLHAEYEIVQVAKPKDVEE